MNEPTNIELTPEEQRLVIPALLEYTNMLHARERKKGVAMYSSITQRVDALRKRMFANCYGVEI